MIGDVIGEKPGYLATLLIKISGAIEVAFVQKCSNEIGIFYEFLRILITKYQEIFFIISFDIQ